jgi:hypothetical protein
MAHQLRGGIMDKSHVGACFCGAVTVEVTGVPLEMGYCHCGSCRAHSGAPVSAYVLWKQDDVKITKGAEFVSRYGKTEMSDRHFCKKCGGHVLVAHPSLGLTHIYPASFPTLTFKPTVHLNYAETVLPMKDGLRKLRDFPAEAGGSGETLPE